MGQAEVWGEGSSVVVTQISGKGDLVFWLAAGVLDEVLSLHRKILERAATRGIRRAHAIGRRGWDKFLRRDGWRESARHYTKEI